MTEHEYLVKNVKSFVGREGHGFNASLYRGKKKVAFLIDSANGGEIDFQWADRKEERVTIHNTEWKGKPHSFKGTPEEKLLYELIDGLPPETSELFPEELKMTPDIFVSGLVDNFETLRQLKRWCRTQTIVKFKDQKEGEYTTYGVPYSKDFGAKLKKKYPDTLVEIVNERFPKED